MPYKMYCDRCGCETEKNYVSKRAIIDWEGWQAEVMLRNPKGAWNGGILCESCLALLLHQGCVRPKNGTDVRTQRSSQEVS